LLDWFLLASMTSCRWQRKEKLLGGWVSTSQSGREGGRREVTYDSWTDGFGFFLFSVLLTLTRPSMLPTA